jgi:hypothetical protein
MRLATLIISLVLMLVAGVQSCAVVAGGSLAEDLSTVAEEQEAGSALAAAGAFGLLGALSWLVAGALVMGRPRASMWIFGGSTLLWLIAGSSGFADAWFWLIASVIFSIMSWRGISERERLDPAHSQAGIGTVAATMGQPAPPQLPPAGWYRNPHGPGQRYWDGSQWTEHQRLDPEPAVDRPPPPRPDGS